MPKFDIAVITAAWCSIGPTIAAARLYGLTAEQAAHALSLTATNWRPDQGRNTSIARSTTLGMRRWPD